MKNKFFLPLLIFSTITMSVNSQSPLNRLDSYFLAGEKDKAAAYAESILNDAKQTLSQKKAVASYLEIRRILGDKTLSDREKRNRLDNGMTAATEAVNASPVCADAYYARGLNRMFAANLVREFSSLNNITDAKDDFIRTYNLDKTHYGSLCELSGIYGYMPELITFGDRNIAVNLSKQLYSIRGSKRDAAQLAALLLRRDWSAKKRNSNRSTAKEAYQIAKSPFEAAAAFEGKESGKNITSESDSVDDRREADALCRKHSLTAEEITGETAWSRDF